MSENTVTTQTPETQIRTSGAEPLPSHHVLFPPAQGNPAAGAALGHSATEVQVVTPSVAAGRSESPRALAMNAFGLVLTEDRELDRFGQFLFLPVLTAGDVPGRGQSF